MNTLCRRRILVRLSRAWRLWPPRAVTVVTFWHSIVLASLIGLIVMSYAYVFPALNPE